MRQQTCDHEPRQSVRILRFSEVVRKTGLSRSSIYQRLRAGDFPASVELGPRAVGFVECEVDGFLSELVRQRDVRGPHPSQSLRKRQPATDRSA